DGTRRPILVNGVEVGAIIASPVERLTRNTDINFDMQQRRASWMIVRYQRCWPRWQHFCWRVACSPRSNGWSRVHTD
ncbi:hypothetical protein, partial [Acinetobacter baumannii]